MKAKAMRWGAVASTWLVCTIGGCGADDDGGETAADAPEDSSSGASSDESGASSESGDACVADCQPGGTVLWETHFGGPGEDGSTAVAVGPDGRIAFVGFTNLTNDGFEWMWNGLVGLVEADGTLVFMDMPVGRTSGVGLASDGSVVVLGNDSDFAMFLRAYDTTGAMKWDSADARTQPVSGGVVAILPNDEIVVGGGTATAGSVARFDGAGAEQMFAELPVNIFVADLLVDGDDIVWVGPDYQSNFWAGRTNLQGAVQWQASGFAERWVPVGLAADGNVIVAAQTTLNGNTQLHIYDSAGTEVATAPLPRADIVVLDLAVLPDGDLLLAGNTTNPTRCWYGRMDTMTTFAWQSNFAAEPADSECHTIDIAPDGTLVVSGLHVSPAGTTDAWIQSVAP